MSSESKTVLSELFSWRHMDKLSTIQAMSAPTLDKNSLVLYKLEAARVKETDQKRITIALMDGDLVRVRPKDVVLLHPGPIGDLSTLNTHAADTGDLMTAWELLAGSETNLRELVDLAFGEFTPANTWAVWKAVADGLYFKGDPDHISVITAEDVRKEKARRDERAEEQRQWDAFVNRVTAGERIDSDSQYLSEVERLALGQQPQSQVLRALGREQTPQNAHDLLLKIGYWDISVNPYPARANLKSDSAQGFVPALAEESRRDLTQLLSLAIDDEGNQDPDDAISWDDGRLWVHIADVAALIEPNAPQDLEARDRGANLYLPEKTVSMLPEDATTRLGLGLDSISPALSFGIDLAADGQIQNIEIAPSWVSVTRWTYEEAEERLTEDIPSKLLEIAGIYEERRREAGAIEISLPEVRVKVQDGEVTVKPFSRLRSRDLVREAMLMAGEAVAVFAQEHDIAIPYTIQDPPAGELPEGNTMSSMFGSRKFLKPSRQTVAPGSHSGLGMVQYAQVTSPLRRYLDLVIHQQIRAYLQGQPLLTQREILDRIGTTDSIKRDLRSTERLSRRHWTLVYLLQNPDWQGEGVIVERHGRRHVTIMPDLDMETDLYLPTEHDLDSRLQVEIQEINLANLESRFRKVASPKNP